MSGWIAISFLNIFFQPQHAARGRRGTIAAMISCTRVSKSFGGRQVLSDVTLAVQPSEWVTIVGASRSGKSTLARLLLRLDEPDHGSIEVDGVPLRTLPASVLQLYRARVGTVLSEPLLHPTDSVLDAVLLPLDLQAAPRDRGEKSALAILKRLGLAGREHAVVSSLSEGERMLVCLARALVHNPLILLADDAAARLDDLQTEAAIALMREAHASGMTVVYLTSDAALANRLPGRAVRLDQGRISSPALAAAKTEAAETAPVSAPVLQKEEVVAPESVAAAPAPALAPTPAPARTVPQPPAPAISPTLAAAFPALRSLPPLQPQQAATPAPAAKPQQAPAPAAKPNNPHARKPPVRGVPRVSKNGMGPGTHVPKQAAAPALKPDAQDRDNDGGHRIRITSINS